MRRRQHKYHFWGSVYALTAFIVAVLILFGPVRIKVSVMWNNAQASENLVEPTLIKAENVDYQVRRSVHNELRSQLKLDFLETQLLPRTRKYGIPDALVAGQWAIESGRATNRADNNYFGLGPGLKFATLDEAVKVYYVSLKHILARKGYNLDTISDPYQILQDLQQGDYRYEGHSPKPLEYVQLVSSVPEYVYYAQ